MEGKAQAGDVVGSLPNMILGQCPEQLISSLAFFPLPFLSLPLSPLLPSSLSLFFSLLHSPPPPPNMDDRQPLRPSQGSLTMGVSSYMSSSP